MGARRRAPVHRAAKRRRSAAARPRSSLGKSLGGPPEREERQASQDQQDGQDSESPQAGEGGKISEGREVQASGQPSAARAEDATLTSLTAPRLARSRTRST